MIDWEVCRQIENNTANQNEINQDKLIISPLINLLMNSSLDDLIMAIDRMGLQWSITRQKSGQHYASIFQDGIVKYQGFSRTNHSEGAKATFVRVLARFLIGEQRDFHHYLVKDKTI